jgi:glycosyltransferase involved in cell wall biosynthesis
MWSASLLREGTAGADSPGEGAAGQAAARPRPHVCFVAAYLAGAWPVISRDPHIELVGGAEVQMAILARLFAASGYRVSMICMDHGQPSPVTLDGVVVHKSFAPEAGVPVVRFVHPRLTSTWQALSAVDADIYYCRTASLAVGVVAEFCRRRGKRLVYAGASDKDFVPGAGGQIRFARDRWLYRRGLRAADAIVAQNAVQRADALRHHGRDAVVIPSCYELPAARSAGPRDRVLWVGTVHEGKRPELLLDLAARLPQRRFVMIGGPRQGSRAYFEAIRARAAALPNVEFKGFLPLAQVEPWFDRARVVVNTSVYEGMPNVFLQAWARGVPTVATVDVGAPCHRVARELEALAREVEWLCESPSAGAQCRRYFERTHSKEEVLSRYERLFAGLAR